MTERLSRSEQELEQAFARETSLERERRLSLLRSAQKRSRSRERERTLRKSSLRFVLLVLTLIGTAVVVTIGMFASLYFLLQ